MPCGHQVTVSLTGYERDRLALQRRGFASDPSDVMTKQTMSETITVRAADLLNEASTVRNVHRVIHEAAWRAVAQPIVSLRTGGVIGYEALTRPLAPSPLDQPSEFLAAASRVGLAEKVDRLWRQASIEQLGPLLPAGAALFLNVAPSVLLGKTLRASALSALVRTYGISPDRVVIELTEEESVADFATLRLAFGSFRSEGFMVAIDDVGAGPSTLQAIAELRPNFIKLDRWLATDIAFDGARRAIVESMVQVAHRTRASVIAEGVESPEQLRALVSLGVDSAQGYLLGRPAARPEAPDEGAVAYILELAGGFSRAAQTDRRLTVGDLAATAIILSPAATGAELISMFEGDDELHQILIADRTNLVGIVTRDRLLRLFAEQFGMALHARKPASFLATSATSVKGGVEAREAVQLALVRPQRLRHDPLVVSMTMNGRPSFGVVEVLDLVEAVFEAEISDARQANPLTGLPGNTKIRAYMNGLGASPDHVVLYVDIDKFKQFNDSYGFGAGDLAIAKLGRMLEEVGAHCGEDAFVGHIGGDDFIIAFRTDDLELARRELIERLQMRWFDPDGNTDCPELTVTIGGAFMDAIEGSRFEDKAAAIARIKTRLKAEGSGSFFVLGEAKFPAVPIAA